MKEKSLGAQARDAYKALEQEKTLFSALARREAEGAFMRIKAVSDDNGVREKDIGKYLAANMWIVEQAYGKATQRQEVAGANGGPVKISVSISRSEDESDGQ